MKKYLIGIVVFCSTLIAIPTDLVPSLHQAIMRTDLNGVKKALAEGADPNVKFHGSTALHQAARYGNFPILEALIAAHATIDSKDLKGVTPLYIAMMHVAHKDERIPLRLIALGAHVNVVDSNGITPLMYAAERGSPKLVQALIAHGADVNAWDSDANTALTRAEKRQHREIIAILQEAGAF